MRLTDLDYDDWLEHAFGHEVRLQQAAWFFDRDCDWWDPEPAVALAYLTRLFEDPEPSFRWYSDSQIAQGLTYLVNTSASGDNGWFSSTDVPIESRVRCVEAIALFFAQLFLPRCTPHLSHLSEADAGPLNGVCYMSAFQLDVVRFPPSAQGREIVTARRGQSERWIVLRLHQGTVRIELEK